MGRGNTPLIRIENLWKVYCLPAALASDSRLDLTALAENNETVVAVKNVSFSVNQGEVFVVMGLSGSGKSTLIRCLLRLIEPTSGRILVDNEDVTAMDAKQLIQFRRTKVAMVFQHYGLLPHRTVLENVAFGLKLCGIARPEREAKAKKSIEMVGLSGWENRYPGELSGGMQQRVGIARALVRDPEVLLMDEPFSGLDPLIRREMQEQLIRLQQELHKTIIFVTHDLSEALRLGDRMAVMRDGVFVQTGKPKEIVMYPADEYVRRFVQDERRIARFAEAQEERPAFHSVEGHKTLLEQKKQAAGKR
ncbi:MAG: quaternary amine ABC transporter ATP-binding protein [bacterium]|jgi:glycine betaine/proline transport system ATP-binding protein